MANDNGTVHPRTSHTAAAIQPTVDPTLLQTLEWRCIGPFRGGRVVAVAGDPAHAQVFYFGSTGGGVWKTTDGGIIWENVSDGYFKRASVGAIAVAPSDPNVVYTGMGETTIRSNVSHGDGVYRSTDGGQTWTHLGLADTRNIAKVRIHPHNPDLVYVAALGHAHGPNAERGVYRSKNGGQTWERILFRSEKAGAIDLSMDPHNPRILYAAIWEAHRKPYTLVSGGEECGLFKSIDGGDSWTEITRNEGLPTGMLGKIGVAVSPARENRVFAIVDAEDGAVFRSDDGGAHWERLSEDRNLWARPWYYMHIIPDPQDAETLWALNVQAWKSIDGGKTFFEVQIPHGDHHDLWIDPHDPRRMIEGNDGGACVSFNGGASWSSIYTQPTAEFYHVFTDNQYPYRVYGPQQDNSTICVPSSSHVSGITNAMTFEVGGGESGYIAIRPDDPNIIYAGSYQGYLTRYDHRTFEERNIAVWPEVATGWGAKDQKYRFQWTAPVLLSPHNPNVLYTTGNHVFRSTDEGSSWEVISPDLTRNDVSKQEASGGPPTKDNTGAEYYCTIFAFAESSITPGLFWAGSDDGLVHISRDGGASWQNVTPVDLPEWALISIIEPSPHDPAAAYLAATRWKWDDFHPYLYKTNDYGATWTKITDGIADNDFTRAIREDPVRRGLLYAGTETGIHISFDDGAHWQSLQANLPVVPIHDLAVKDSDLVVATHGRSFWILDDITPLRQASAQLQQFQQSPTHLFKPRPTIYFGVNYGYSRSAQSGNFFRDTDNTQLVARRFERPGKIWVERPLNAGQNPPGGVIVYYSLAEKPEGEVKMAFMDAAGNEIKAFTSKSERKKSADPTDEEEEEEKQEPNVSTGIGLNRFVWNMRYPDPRKVDGYVASEGAMSGPVIVPGTYQVALTVGENSLVESFEVLQDPRIPATQADLEARLALHLKLRDKLSETHDTINTLRNVRRQIDDWLKWTKEQPAHEPLERLGKSIKEQLQPIEDELIQSKAKTRQDTLNHPAKLNGKLAGLASVVGSAQAAPTKQSYELFDDLSQRIDAQAQRLREVLDGDVVAFNSLLHEHNVPAIIPVATMDNRNGRKDSRNGKK
jgi:photosystem II stability/assembly factor-like uncharacterized protein